jgi:hypothetical protein
MKLVAILAILAVIVFVFVPIVKDSSVVSGIYMEPVYAKVSFSFLVFGFGTVMIPWCIATFAISNNIRSACTSIGSSSTSTSYYTTTSNSN